jgi:SPP1 gp7 family putative phage head morphogenesis protein
MADTLESIIIRHQVFLQRLVPQLGREQIAIIDKNNPELRGELEAWLEKNELYKLTKKQQDDLVVLRNRVYKLRSGAILDADEKYQDDMFKLAESEQLWFANGVEDLGGKSLALSSTASLAKMVERQPFLGKTLNQIYEKLSVDDTDRIMTTVANGLDSGLTRAQIQRSIFGSAKLNYTDGILQQTRNYINNTNTNSGVVRTTINGVQNESKRMLFEANSDIVNKVQYSATLDGRTSDICASRDGKIYKLGFEPPLPAHINCRSTYIPIIDGIDIESTRPYVADTRTRKEREKDFRALAKENGTTIKQEREAWKKKAIGQVSDKTTYDSWFKTQPVAFQKEALGATKYKLYSKGGITFDRFVDPTNKSYTLDELYKIDKDAFKRAGLDKPK